MFNSLLKRATLGLFCLVFLVVLIWLLSVPTHAQAQRVLEAKNILVLHSFEANVPVFVGTDRGLSTTLESGGISSVNQFFESLDLRRNPGPEHRKLLVEQMRVRYSHRKLDMIITIYPEALEFVLKDCRDILPDAPILAMYLPQGFELPETGRRIIGHSARPDIIGTLEIALKLVPGAKRVYVVSGVHEVDRRIEDRARRELKKWETRLEFHYLSHMSFEDMLATLSSAPPDSIILALILSQDVTGRSYTSPIVAQRLSQVSPAPIFGLLDVALGHGIAGGSLINFERIGTKAGELVLDILRGTPTTENVPAFLNVPPMPMFDRRQLRHWNLSEAALPQGSIVINKEFTLWDLRYYAIGLLAFCLLETAFIVILIIQRRRKKVAEEGLRQKTEELDHFFNVTLDLLCIANTDGYFLRLNPAVERILGYTREELMAKRFFDFIHPDDLDRTREAVSALGSQQKVFLFENRYRFKDGTYRWLEWSSAPAGKLIYAAARDVTERKRAEEALRQSEERFRQVAETVGDFIWEVDANGLYRYTSPSVEKILGYMPGELIGKIHFYDLFAPEVREELKTAAFKVFAAKRAFRAFSNPNTSKEGKVVHLETSGVPVLDETGNLLGYRGADTDVTERKRAEKEAIEARRELLRMDRLSRMGELSASLSHELNQPLTAILSNARAALRFLQADKLDPGELKEILQDIVNDDKRAGDIIRSLRSLVKRDEGERETISINDVLHETVSLFRSEAIVRNLRIEMDLANPLPLLYVSKVQIQQVLINLMMNAAESTTRDVSANRVIVLQTVASHDSVVQVAVRDFGSGIEEPELHRIFEPFFTTKRSGLGMGLSLSHSIIESHGGHIWAENNPDKGITFYFDLPGITNQ